MSAKLANIARGCATKKEIATKLKGEELAECWRIKQIQTMRAKRKPDPHWNPRPLNEWERKDRGLKSEAIDSALIWPSAYYFGVNFRAKIAAQINKVWTFKYRWHEYHVSVSHGLTPGQDIRHAGSGCITYPFNLRMDCLRQEAVWIGGMLTIRAKTDARKSSYPCWWFERRESDPHLHMRIGRIIRRNHHIEDETEREKRLAPERAKRADYKQRNSVRLAAAKIQKQAEKKRIKEMRDLENLINSIPPSRPPKGWVSRESSIAAGNCQGGTDNFIACKVRPWLEQRGFTVGILHGAAITRKTLMEIEKSEFTKRL